MQVLRKNNLDVCYITTIQTKLQIQEKSRYATGIPMLMHFFSMRSNWSIYKPYNAARHPTICDVINDVKLFLTVYRRIIDVMQSDIASQTQTALGCIMPVKSSPYILVLLKHMNCLAHIKTPFSDYFELATAGVVFFFFFILTCYCLDIIFSSR